MLPLAPRFAAQSLQGDHLGTAPVMLRGGPAAPLQAFRRPRAGAWPGRGGVGAAPGHHLGATVPVTAACPPSPHRNVLTVTTCWSPYRSHARVSMARRAVSSIRADAHAIRIASMLCACYLGSGAAGKYPR